MSPPPPLPEASPPALFDAVLRPHRSLPPLGFAVVMAALGGGSFIAGVICILMGAWPVTPFLGVDVLLVYVAFRLNYRSARQTERVRLTKDRLDVERIGVRGERRHWEFQPFWLRVDLEEQDEDSNRLILSSHGRTLIVGSFLGPGERRTFAGRLKDALARWRRSMTAQDL